MKILLLFVMLFSIKAYGFIDGKTKVICTYFTVVETEKFIHYSNMKLDGILIKPYKGSFIIFLLFLFFLEATINQ